jgi:hypothetical protein
MAGAPNARDLLLLALENGEHFVLTHDEALFAVNLDLLAGVLAEQDRVASIKSSPNRLPSSFCLTAPAAITLPCWGFSLALSGMMMPPTFCSPSSMR